jgi:hypothetical protein
VRIRWPCRCVPVKNRRGDETDPGTVHCAEQQWREAEMMARQAELRVQQAWAVHLASGVGVPEAILTQARILRILATEKLAAWVLRRPHGPGT